jgi:hypothetical protein
MTRRLVAPLVLAHAAALAVVAGLVVACGGGSSDDGSAAPSCPSVGSLSCPSTPPSFASEIEPLVEERCYGCHGPGGVEVASINLTSYGQIAKQSGTIAVEIQSCMMPQPDAGPLTIDQLKTFLEWIECGSPNN